MKFKVIHPFSAYNRETGETRQFALNQVITGELYREDGKIIGILFQGFILPMSSLKAVPETAKMILVGLCIVGAFIMIYLLTKEL